MKQEIEKKKICGLFLDYKVTNLGEQHPKCGDSVIFARWYVHQRCIYLIKIQENSNIAKYYHLK